MMKIKRLYFGVAVLACSQAWAGGISEPLQRDQISALKVMTSQWAVSARAQINADMRIQQAKIASMGMMAKMLEQLEAFRSFSAFTGQGVNVCGAVMNQGDVNRIAQERGRYDFTQMVNGGRLGAAPSDYQLAHAKRQLDKYCPPDFNNLGLCKSNFDSVVGASVNYGRLTADTEQFTKKQLEAAGDYVANLVPTAPQTSRLSASKCDAGCIQARVEGMQSDAYSSLIAAPMGDHFAYRIGAKTFAKKQDGK